MYKLWRRNYNTIKIKMIEEIIEAIVCFWDSIFGGKKEE